ncbi:MAG: hypothetical protein Q4E89_00250 [Eubacteriales bacterium]|nr:hypothetical protein [Eubacteriales bacterium]
MNIITKLERKFHGRGIPNLTIWIIACYIIGYVLQIVNPSIFQFLYLDPVYILKGQVWRLVTWVLVPPGSFSFFTIITLFFYYSIGVSMERTWGEFRYSLYIISGLIFTIIGAFFLFFIILLTTGERCSVGSIFSTYYVTMSIFLAFAATYPEMQVFLYGILPLKVKWMGFIYGAVILYDLVTYIRRGVWFMAIPMIASLLNFIIYFFSTRNLSRYNPKEVKRRREFRKAMQPSGRMKSQGGAITKHKCAVCGQTELDNPDLEFRFCSKCNGNYEYCQNHLFTHQHIK